MTQKDLYLKMIHFIIQIEDISVIDIEDPFLHDDLDELCAELHGRITSPSFIRIINMLITTSDPSINPTLEDPIIETRILLEDNYTALERKYKRDFYQINPSLSVIDSSVWFDSGILIDFTSPESLEKWKLFENIFYLMSDDQRKDLFERIHLNTLEKCYFIKDPTIISNELTKLYSYSLLQYLNENKTLPLNPGLLYTPTNPLCNSLAYNNTVKYEQYLDIFDVLNELNHSTNILDRFFKLYHILEFMTFRIMLVDIANGTTLHRSFLRQIEQMTKKTQSKEYDSFAKNFKRLFSLDISSIKSGINHIVFGTTEQNFLKNNFDIRNCPSSIHGFDIGHISKIIYQVRCNIVHNKDSEMHYTITYPEDYSIILPLIFGLVKTLENLLIIKINTAGIDLEYSTRELMMY